MTYFSCCCCCETSDFRPLSETINDGDSESSEDSVFSSENAISRVVSSSIGSDSFQRNHLKGPVTREDVLRALSPSPEIDSYQKNNLNGRVTLDKIPKFSAAKRLATGNAIPTSLKSPPDLK